MKIVGIQFSFLAIRGCLKKATSLLFKALVNLIELIIFRYKQLMINGQTTTYL
jgi:hypothetical protein